MSVGSRVTFATWRLYRTSALARRLLDPVLRRSAEKGLARHDRFVSEAHPSHAWASPRPAAEPRLSVRLTQSLGADALRLLGLLNHWGARYDTTPHGSSALALGPVAAPGAKFEPGVVFAIPGASVNPVELSRLVDEKHPIARRVRDGAGRPLTSVVVEERPRRVFLPAHVLAPSFVASPWGCLVPDAIDWALGRSDWRDPLPPLVSARIDDVMGEGGLGWLRAFEERGLRPSIGTLHDRWLAGPSVKALVEASRRGCSVSPHAFDMDRFIWFDAHSARPFTPARRADHAAKIARDVAATGLVLGATVNAHFDVFGDTAAEPAARLGFRYLLGEHRLSQDWREAPRARDPLGTPLYCYDRQGPLIGFQAQGAIASSAAARSRYDWLRNFMAVDRRTNLPVKESLDRSGAVRQGAMQLLSALYAGFPAYLLAHEVHLDVLGPDLVGELLDAVLRDVKELVPDARPAAFDELPAACASRATSIREAPPTVRGEVSRAPYRNEATRREGS